MDSTGSGWWARHGWTVALLLTAFGIALLIRTVFMAALIQQFGPLNLYGGGSDSFYHSRVMEYIILNHHNLVNDGMLKYPLGAINPREPLFDWMNAVLGIVFAPLFGGSAVTAGAFFLDLQGPLWAALGVFPVYLIGKEVASKRVGLVAVFIYPFLVANIDSSTLGYANYLSFYTFFILLTIYGYLRTIRAAGTRRWVERYRRPADIVAGLRGFYRTERAAVKWAVFTGVCFGALSLAWQGFSFAVAAIVVFLAVMLIIERIRRVDSFGLYVATWIVGGVGFLMAVPYYLPQGLFASWFGLPAVAFFGGLLILLPFVVLRDQPWVVSIPVLIGTAAVAIGGLFVVDRSAFTNIVTGQGYFVKTLVYSTVAEAQAPSVDALILGYGVITFFLAFVGLALLVYSIARHRFRRVEMMFLVFAIIDIYLPITAAKFFYIGSPVFALLPAIAILRALDVGGYPGLRRNVASLSDRRSQFSAFRKSIKARHFLILILVVGLLLPNVWYAIDAGVPYNLKTPYNQQIFNSLPSALQPTAPSASSNFFLGAAGTQLDTPPQYDENGYDWLAMQDGNLPAPQRPAFISWWDYGFQAVAEGQHPTVADNFQNGIVPAGNFLLAQNESLAIGILATTLLQAEAKTSGQANLPAPLNVELARDGVNLTTLHGLMTNTSQDVQTVLAHPDRYLAVDPTTIDGQNAMYDTVSYFLASTLSESGVVQVYSDVQSYTGWSIRYAMVDSRLFPFSGSNTGIFYAPADLTDRVIGSGGAPTAYYTLSVTGSDGNTYPVNALPAGVTAANYNINYLPAFYHSMIYRTYIGYNGTQVGQGAGIPGLSSGAVQSDPIMPGWMMQHFEVVYRTAYYCPYANPSGHTGCFSAMNLPTATQLAKKNNGTADTSASSYFQGGETMLEYFPGETMTGTVALPDGTPVAQARVTVYDGWGIPHMTTTSSSDGAYSIILPPGNDTVNVTTGPVNGLSQAGTTSLATIHLYVPQALGGVPGAPTLVRPIVLAPAHVQGFLYWNAAGNATFVPNADTLVNGARVTVWGSGLPARSTTTDASGAFLLPNVPPGVYNFSVRVAGANYTNSSWTVYAGAGKTVNETQGLAPAKVTGRATFANGVPAVGAIITVSNRTHVISTTTVNVTGTFSLVNLPPGNYSLAASAQGGAMSAAPQAFNVATEGQKLTTNVTLVPVVRVALTVVANGNPAASFPVRFAPLVPLEPPSIPSNRTGNQSAGSTPPGGAPPPPSPPGSPAQLNATVIFTDANGQITATLPAGNYSVYGFGLVNGQWQSAFASAYISSTPGGAVTLAPLFLAPAVRLSGFATLTGGASATSPIVVTAYDARGNQVSTFANSTHDFSLWLPSATYTISAEEGASTRGAIVYAAQSVVNLTYATFLPLTLGNGARLSAVVGSITTSAFVPAFEATVKLSLTPGAGTVTALSNASGNVSLVVPEGILSSQSYCLNVSAFGYLPYQRCGIAPSELGVMTSIPLTIRPALVFVNLSGLTGGTRFTLNFSANSSTARSVSVVGGPTFAVNVTPGNYRVNGYAPVNNSSGLLLPSQVTSVTIPLGARTDNLSFSVVRELATIGMLALPAGLSNASVAVRLTSPTLNLSLSGAQFESKFFATPSTYQVFAQGTVGNMTYATITNVTLNATGVFSSSISLTAPGTQVEGTLVGPTGAVLNATVPVTLVGPSGFTLEASAANGRFTLDLPVNLTFGVAVRTTQLISTSAGPRYEVYTSLPGATCVTQRAASNCTIALSARAVMSYLNGTFAFDAFPSPLAGALRLVGPFPSTNVTNVSVPASGFAQALLPGTYSLYATSGAGGGMLANVSDVVVGPTPSPAVVVRLHPTWQLAITIVPPGAGSPTAATVWIHGPPGISLALGGVTFRVPVVVALPYGVYTIQANTSGTPYGVPVLATATTVVGLQNGNGAVTLAPSYEVRRTATLTLLAPTQVVAAPGSSVSFALSVTNSGTAPEAIHFVGTPSYWNFTFVPGNVTLGVTGTNQSAAVEAIVHVPSGTLVAHPTIQIEAVVDATGSVAGFAQPLPQIVVPASPGLRIGALPPAGALIAPYTAHVPFYVLNTGNFPEGFDLAVTDASRLAGLGWTASVGTGSTTLLTSQILQPGANRTYDVLLTSPSAQALPPGNVTVVAHLLNASGSVRASVTLSVPSVPLSVNSSSIFVTGPGIGSPPAYPEQLVWLLSFVPAIALVVGVVVYRLWRTRRWVRR
ncbi:MAG: carboxypeptidase regulatory-like domain-containing protein [Thermoplasmata archaeon]